ncbi:MAG: hypothetical protein KIT02_02830 [Devosia sp.]|uniref:DUF6634 family protein n=1 Tax=Devosia sp. TaxID=1871048 RepID=UPI0024C6E0BA|nr:DUF6634 family protein [Devosia sp.]UYO00181.1 MAG: hypothetical protein KIT02_02830 [Devosia sp.]
MDDLMKRLMSLAVLSGITPRPSERELDAAPVLSNWSLARVPGDAGLALVGSVVGHPRLGDRPAIVTSELIAFYPADGWARTRSRVYRLAPQDGGRDGHP